MSWQAITSTDPPAFIDGRMRMVVIFTDGTQKLAKTFFAIDADDLKRQAAAFVPSIDAVQTSAKPIQPNTAIDLTPPTPPADRPPTAAELHRAAVYDALRDVRRARNAASLGVGTEKAYDDALAIFQALYVAETDLPLLGGVV